MPDGADLVMVNGRVRTMAGATPPGSAVVMSEGRILAVASGDEVADFVGARTEVVDVHGAAILPGFIETHMHPVMVGLSMAEAETGTPPNRTIADVVASLATFAAQRPAGAPVTSWGFDDSAIAEGRHLTRHDLDAATTAHPVMVRHVSGHIAYVSTVVLERAGIDRNTPDPQGGRIVRDGSGEPTGVLEEPSAMALVHSQFPAPGPEEFVAAIERISARCLAVGVTTAHDLFVTSPAQLAAMATARDTGRLGVRFHAYLGWHLLDGALDGRVGVEADDWLRVGGIKLLADGSIQGYTACLSAPYFDRPDATGVAVLSADELTSLVGRAHDAGLQVAVHTNGDAAIDTALDALEQAVAHSPGRDHRHRLEHVQTVREDQLDRIARAKLLPSVFVNHVYYWGDRHRERFLGPERAARISPLRSIEDRSIPFALHCDCPVTPVDPLFTVSAAVNRRTSGGHELGPEQRVDAATALRGYTSDAARFSFDEASRGTIEPGKLADLVVLDDDPVTVGPTDIAGIGVQMTIVGGEIRYAR